MRTAIAVLLLSLPAFADDPPLTEAEPAALTATITSGHEITGDDGKVQSERKPFEVYDRIKLESSGSTGAKKYIWGVFVDFDANPADMAGKAPQSVIDAVRTVQEYGGKASLPTKDNGGIIQEYNDGTVLDILPVPGTYYVTLVAIADNEGDQTQAVIRVKPYPTGGPPPDPDEPDEPDEPDDQPPPPPPPPGTVYDFSDDASLWLLTLVDHTPKQVAEISRLCLSFADDKRATSRAYLDAKFGIGAALALGNQEGAIEAWQPFFEAMNDAFGAIPSTASVEQYRAAYVSVGKGLAE